MTASRKYRTTLSACSRKSLCAVLQAVAGSGIISTADIRLRNDIAPPLLKGERPLVGHVLDVPATVLAYQPQAEATFRQGIVVIENIDGNLDGQQVAAVGAFAETRLAVFDDLGVPQRQLV